MCTHSHLLNLYKGLTKDQQHSADFHTKGQTHTAHIDTLFHIEHFAFVYRSSSHFHEVRLQHSEISVLFSLVHTRILTAISKGTLHSLCFYIFYLWTLPCTCIYHFCNSCQLIQLCSRNNAYIAYCCTTNKTLQLIPIRLKRPVNTEIYILHI